MRSDAGDVKAAQGRGGRCQRRRRHLLSRIQGARREPPLHTRFSQRGSGLLHARRFDESQWFLQQGRRNRGIDPAIQNDGVGRALMQAIMRRSQERGFAGMRLVQAGYHHRSLALYSTLGFDVREPLACLQGPAIGKAVSGHAVTESCCDGVWQRACASPKR
jgi:GNAT superfamily N-acetyltransferase